MEEVLHIGQKKGDIIKKDIAVSLAIAFSVASLSNLLSLNISQQ